MFQRKDKLENEPADNTQAEGADQCAVYVAVPKTVGTGISTRPFADPGERLIVAERNADELELKRFAFRDEGEAKALHAMWKRDQEAKRRAAEEAARRKLGKLTDQLASAP